MSREREREKEKRRYDTVERCHERDDTERKYREREREMTRRRDAKNKLTLRKYVRKQLKLSAFVKTVHHVPASLECQTEMKPNHYHNSYHKWWRNSESLYPLPTIDRSFEHVFTKSQALQAIFKCHGVVWVIHWRFLMSIHGLGPFVSLARGAFSGLPRQPIPSWDCLFKNGAELVGIDY